ncbi:unnamed protein product [Camellia sinensis]
MVVNTPIHTIMMWTMLILMFILDMSIHILLNMHFLKRSFCWFVRFGRKTSCGTGKDNISDAPNGSTHHIKSVVEKELSHSPSNLVFGYLNLFSDGTILLMGWLWEVLSSFMDQLVGSQELCFCLHMSFLKSAFVMGQDQGQSSLIEGFTTGGFVYITIAKVLAEMNNGNSLAIKSTVLQLTSLISGMAVTLYISLVE